MLLLDFVAFTAAFGWLSMLLCWVLLRLTLTRRLKKELQPKGEYWETGTMDFGFLNTIAFAWAIVLPWVQRSVKFRLLYPHLDVKARANVFEKVMGYGTIGGLFVMMIFGLIFVLIEP